MWYQCYNIIAFIKDTNFYSDNFYSSLYLFTLAPSLVECTSLATSTSMCVSIVMMTSTPSSCWSCSASTGSAFKSAIQRTPVASTRCRCNTSRWRTSAGHCLWCWPVWPLLATDPFQDLQHVSCLSFFDRGISSALMNCKRHSLNHGSVGQFQCWSACWTVWQWDHISSWQTNTGKDRHHSWTPVWSLV